MSEPLPIGWTVFLEPSVPAFVVATALVTFGAWRLAAGGPTPRTRVIGFAIWAATWVVVAAQLLSLAGQLHWPGMLLLSALGALAVRTFRPAAAGGVALQWRALRACPPRDVAWIVAFALPALAYAGWCAWLTLVSPEPFGDNTSYHIPRLAYWMQHATLAPFTSNDPRIPSFPVVANLLQLWPALFLKTDRLGALVQISAHLGTALCVYGISRDLGAPRPDAAAAAYTWLAIPVALQQATNSNVDVIAAFFVAAAAGTALSSVQRGGGPWLALTGFASACLAVGAKPHTVPVALACGGIAWRALARARPRRLRRWLPAVLVLATLVTVVQPLSNLRAFGTPSGLASVQWIVVNPGLPTLAKNLQLMLLPVSGRSRALERGLGASWLLLIAAAVPVVAVSGARAVRRHALRLAYTALGVAYGVLVLFTLRHQPSVERFLLPAAALLTPVVTALFLRRIGGVLLACVWLAGSVGLFHWAHFEMRWRRPLGRFLVYEDAQGVTSLATLARAADRVAASGRGRRIGLITAQGFIQRLLLGPRFENALVPLSYDPPATPAAAERLALDALLIDAGMGGFETQLFRRRFTPPADPPADGWRLTAPDAFDADFLRAYEPAVEYPRFAETALAFGRAGSGWTLDRSVRLNVLFFVRAPRDRAALSLINVGGTSTLEDVNGLPFFWIGRGTVLTVFAGERGTAVFEARVRRGRHLVGEGARVEISGEGSVVGQARVEVGGLLRLPLPVDQGLNRFILRVADAPVRGVAAGERVDQLGLVNLRIRWDGPPAGPLGSRPGGSVEAQRRSEKRGSGRIGRRAMLGCRPVYGSRFSPDRSADSSTGA